MTAQNYSWHAEGWRHAQAAIARGAHALLLTGAKGLGKRALALNLAAQYLCAARDAQRLACGSCESCRWLAAGTHPDFALIEPLAEEEGSDAATAPGTAARARPISIDQVRALREHLALSGHRDAGKVVVVQPAESLNVAAANALLKNLEEPPARTLFILVAHRSALLLPTVRSRCQLVPVKLDDWSTAEDWLRSQGLENAAQQLALCGGAPLEALAVAADPAFAHRADLLSDLIAEGADGVSLAEKYRELPPATLLSWLQKWTFDLLLMRLCGRARYHQDLKAQISKCAAPIDPIALTRFHRRLLAMQRHIHHPLNPRLLTEQLLIDFRRLLVPGQGSQA